MLNPGRVLRTKMFVDYIELKMGKKRQDNDKETADGKD